MKQSLHRLTGGSAAATVHVEPARKREEEDREAAQFRVEVPGVTPVCQTPIIHIRVSLNESAAQKLAAVRMLYDFLVVRQITPSNPAHAVRGPKYVVKKGTSKRDIHAEPIQDAG